MWGNFGHVDSVLVLRPELGIPVCLQEERKVEQISTVDRGLKNGFLVRVQAKLDLTEIFGRQIPGDFDTSGWRSPWTGKSKTKEPSALIYSDIVTS